MLALPDTLPTVKKVIFTLAHMLIIGEPLQFEAVFSFPEEPVIELPEPPAPEIDNRPIKTTIGTLRKKKAWAMDSQYPSIKYHDHELANVRIGDYVVIPPSTRRPKTCYYKVQARTGSTLYLEDTIYLPRYS
jgi:hypothetical protein